MALTAKKPRKKKLNGHHQVKYFTVKLKPGEKLFSLDIEKEWIAEEPTIYVAGVGPTYTPKKGFIYVTARTIEYANSKFEQIIASAMERAKNKKKKKDDEGNR